MSTWTVIGFWHGNEPYVAGVVKEDVPVFGGSDLLYDEEANFQGPWNLPVEANSAEGAEEQALAQLRAAEDKDDEEDSGAIADGYDPSAADGPDPEGTGPLPTYAG